jgi:cation diffusion facilitator family transporter
MSTPDTHKHPRDEDDHAHLHEGESHPHPHPHEDDHTHPHSHDDDDGAHGHTHGGGGHTHGPGEGHEHPTGIKGFLYGLFVPHSHDAADSIDDALEASKEGVRALKISLFILLATTALQLVVVLFSGSVALFADTVHNFSDALTAVPLWIAFILGRRVASRRYSFGLGRVEDLAGLFIVMMIALSAIVAAWQSIDRIINPQPLNNLWWVLGAGVIGFLGNELVAIYRIRVGRRIGSAALVADGIHARTDGFTSLAVVFGAIGVLLGFPLADPIVGIIISVTIFILLIGTVRNIGRRLLDGIDPDLMDRAEVAIAGTPGVIAVNRLQLRWLGHRLNGTATVQVEQSTAQATNAAIRESLSKSLPNLDDIVIENVAAPPTAT